MRDPTIALLSDGLCADIDRLPGHDDATHPQVPTHDPPGEAFPGACPFHDAPLRRPSNTPLASFIEYHTVRYRVLASQPLV